MAGKTKDPHGMAQNCPVKSHVLWKWHMCLGRYCLKFKHKHTVNVIGSPAYSYWSNHQRNNNKAVHNQQSNVL